MSRRVRLVLIGIGIIAVAVVVVVLLILPMSNDIDDLRSKIEDEDMKIEALSLELMHAEDTQRQGRHNQARLVELAKMIPEEAQVPSLILQIQDMADKAGIDWIQISPGPPTGELDLGYQTLQLSLNFGGTFYDVSDFIYRAEQMVAGPGRLLAVKDVTFSPNIDEESGSVETSPELDVRMTLLAFVVAAEVPAAAAAPAAPATDDADATDTTDTTESE